MAAYNSYKNTIVADSPISYHRMNESSGTNATDSSGNGNTATYSASGVTYSVAGALRGDTDNAVTFNGSTGKITLPGGINPTSGSAFSLECWIKASSFSGNKSILANYSSNGDFTLNFGTGLGMHGANPVFDIAVPSSATFAEISGTSLSVNVWHHLVGTWDGTTMRLYVDGTQAASAARATIEPATSAVIIGSSSYNDYFPGNMDEAAIYTTALSSTQVSNHYKAGLSSIKSAQIRTKVFTRLTKLVQIRTRIQTKKIASLVLRNVVRTVKTISSPVIRTAIRTARTKSIPIRMVSKTQNAPLTRIHTPVKTRVVRLNAIRAVVRGVTFVSRMRAGIHTRISRSAATRTSVRTRFTRNTPIRTPLKSMGIPSLSVRTYIHTFIVRSQILRMVVRALKVPITALRVPVAAFLSKSFSIRSRVKTQTTPALHIRSFLQTRVTRSVPFRVVLRSMILVTHLRIIIQTRIAQSSVLRSRVHTQTSKSIVVRTLTSSLIGTSTLIRTRIRSLSIRSLAARIGIRTFQNVSLALKVVTRTQGARLASLRATIRGNTLITPLRSLIRTRTTSLSLLRTPMRTQVGKTIHIHTSAKTQVRMSSFLRLLLITQQTQSLVVHTVVAVRKAVATGTRIPLHTKETILIPLRIVARGIILLTRVRIIIQTSLTRSTPLRMVISTIQSIPIILRIMIRSVATKSTPLLVVLRGITRVAAMRLGVNTLYTSPMYIKTKIHTLNTNIIELRVIITNVIPRVIVQIRVSIHSMRTRGAVLSLLIQTFKNVSTSTRIVIQTPGKRSLPLRAPIGTKVDGNLPLMILIKFANASYVDLRIVVRGTTNITLARIPVKTLITALSSFRSVVGTGARKALALRVMSASQIAHSLTLRAAIRGRTRIALVRMHLTTLSECSLTARILIDVEQNMSTWFRISIGTLHTQGTHLRMRMGTSLTTPSLMRITLRSAESRNAVIRLSSNTQQSLLSVIRNAIHDIQAQKVHFRTNIQTASDRAFVLRILTTRAITPTSALRIHVASVGPGVNATLYVRKGHATTYIRKGNAITYVRKGNVTTRVR